MKKTIVALVAVCAAMFALPGIASAGVWHLEPEDGTTTQTLSMAGGAATLVSTNGTDDVARSEINCTSVDGTGNYENTTTGTLTLTFHSCTTVVLGFKVNCTGTEPAQPTGTIQTTSLPFHNILIDPGTPGILLTPNASGAFAHFNCGGVNVTVTGNGVIGDLTKACGSTGVTSGVVDFDIVNNTQKYTQITTAGTVYRLAKGTEMAAQKGSGTVTNSKKSKINCTP